MTWLKKDAEILGLQVKQWDEEERENNFYNCHETCLPNPETSDFTIEEFYTKETLDQRKEDKLMCDRCGKEIKVT